MSTRPTEDEIAAMQDALRYIGTWVRAYPVEMFEELTQAEMAAIQRFIGSELMSRLHASWARHILAGIARYVDAGLPRGETVQ
jgi:hypothetical protein